MLCPYRKNLETMCTVQAPLNSTNKHMSTPGTGEIEKAGTLNLRFLPA